MGNNCCLDWSIKNECYCYFLYSKYVIINVKFVNFKVLVWKFRMVNKYIDNFVELKYIIKENL